MIPMFSLDFYGHTWWWIFPLLMIILCIVMCLFVMRGRMGSVMCRPGSRRTGSHGGDASDSALDILNKRYAQGEINKEEYEEEKRDITLHEWLCTSQKEIANHRDYRRYEMYTEETKDKGDRAKSTTSDLLRWVQGCLR
jgi:putative membrane protein